MRRLKKEVTNKIPLRSEHDEQVSLFKMIALHAIKYPALRFAFAVPNGARTSLRVAVKLKAEGLRKGCPDIMVPIPTYLGATDQEGGIRHVCGLFIEMKKRGKNQKLKPHQVEFQKYLIDAGYQHNVCYTADEAMQVILDYIIL